MSEDESEILKRAAASASSTGWLLNGLYFGFTLAALTMVTVPLVMMLPEGIQRVLVITGGNKVIPVWAFFIAVPLWVAPRLLTARGWTRELEWVNALPFEIDNYARAMGNSPRTSSDFKMQIEFIGDPPDDAVLHERLDLETGSWMFHFKGRRVILERSPSLVQRSDERNRRLLLWFHDLVERKLLPLHEAHPIKSFRFDLH
jgi:hypothetical protein